MTATDERITRYTFGEARTNHGQLVRFGAPAEDIAEIKTAFSRVTYFQLPESHPANVQHGGYGRWSRYRLEQREYAGGGSGFIEALEVMDAPKGRVRHLVHRYDNYFGAVFWEFARQPDANQAWEKCWGAGRDIEDRLPQQPGYLRTVYCGPLTPWFYAIGEQELVGDYAFPENIQDDPFYRFGRQFVVEDDQRLPRIKTCLGARFLTDSTDRRLHDYARIMVYWNDGTYTMIGERQIQHSWKTDFVPQRPRLLEPGEEWIGEAITKFQTLLAGGSRQFEIKFLDGSRFVGKVYPSKTSARPAPAGRYSAVVTFSDGKEPRDGWFDFEPTPELPTPEALIRSKLSGVLSVEITDNSLSNLSKRKWRGVFHAPPPAEAE